MTWLIVGVDRRTLAPWHKNVLERDPDAVDGPRRAEPRVGLDRAGRGSRFVRRGLGLWVVLLAAIAHDERADRDDRADRYREGVHPSRYAQEQQDREREDAEHDEQ